MSQPLSEDDERLSACTSPLVGAARVPPHVLLTTVAGVALMCVCSLIMSGIALVRTVPTPPAPTTGPNPGLVSKIAFGSCTSYDFRPQPLWEEAVIPSDLDAWIWAGDLVYLDRTNVNCGLRPDHPQCNCSREDWLMKPPYSCEAGNYDHALLRAQAQLRHPDYRRFLDHMCPYSTRPGAPDGDNPIVCPRPILGTWDDHDYGWDNGNTRLPSRRVAKNLFLDLLGVASDSPRRTSVAGVEWVHHLNLQVPDQRIDVILLDVRYDRQPLPCYVRRTWCEEEVIPRGPHNNDDYGWCMDYVVDGGLFSRGSCCTKDDDIQYGWCIRNNPETSPLWTEACDPLSPSFGTRSLVLHGDTLTVPDGTEERDSYQDSTFCEVLGKGQRDWLRTVLVGSSAPLKLVVTGSVLLGKGGLRNCSGDDWDCYRPAQQRLIQTLNGATGGCVVVLTGDYHYSDIKVALPGETLYSEAYGTKNLKAPIWQVMASGLTTSTAIPYPCDDWTSDPAHLRTHPECSFVTGPNFGYLDVDWSARLVHLQIRSGVTGATRLSVTVDLDTCQETTAP